MREEWVEAHDLELDLEQNEQKTMQFHHEKKIIANTSRETGATLKTAEGDEEL